ncbi:MAG: hypothetical protein U0841_10275 [Chloroflexia bacterium]
MAMHAMATDGANPALGWARAARCTRRSTPTRTACAQGCRQFWQIFVRIVNSAHYQQITGQLPPTSPVDAKTYTAHGYPWFDLYDEPLGTYPHRMHWLASGSFA